MEAFLQHPWISPFWAFIQAHPGLWFFLFILVAIPWLLNTLANLIPQIDVLRSKILLPIAKKYKQKKLIKSAVKSDIRGHVNREIAKMRNHLPAGWTGEMDVDWVEAEEPSTLKDDNKIIVRIRPVEDQDRNFVNAAYYYLRSSFFPKTQAVVPKPHYEASVLHVCRKIAESRSAATKTFFEDHILEPAIQRHQHIPDHLEDYAELDKRGFFTGTFLRELHLMATDARFTRARANMTQETASVIDHIKAFITAYDAHHAGQGEMSPTAWYNDGAVSRYAILLVANPAKTENGIDAYLNRARSRFQSGSRRLYVFGANKESRFANAVISGIEGTIDGVRLVEKFETPFDYRGNKSGVGAVFELL